MGAAFTQLALSVAQKSCKTHKETGFKRTAGMTDKQITRFFDLHMKSYKNGGLWLFNLFCIERDAREDQVVRITRKKHESEKQRQIMEAVQNAVEFAKITIG